MVKKFLSVVGSSIILTVIASAVFAAILFVPDVYKLGMSCDIDTHYQGYSNQFECERAYRADPRSYEWILTQQEYLILAVSAGLMFTTGVIGAYWPEKKPARIIGHGSTEHSNP